MIPTPRITKWCDHTWGYLTVLAAEVLAQHLKTKVNVRATRQLPSCQRYSYTLLRSQTLPTLHAPTRTGFALGEGGVVDKMLLHLKAAIGTKYRTCRPYRGPDFTYRVVNRQELRSNCRDERLSSDDPRQTVTAPCQRPVRTLRCSESMRSSSQSLTLDRIVYPGE